MRAMMAGAALAAAMACGWASRAEASPVSIDAVFGFGSGTDRFILNYDTAAPTMATFSFKYENNDFINPAQAAQFSDPNASISLSPVNILKQSQYSTYTRTISIFDPSFAYDVTATSNGNDTVTGYKGYRFDLELILDGDPSDLSNIYGGYTSPGGIFGGGLAVDYSDITARGAVYATSPVPIPASAPLFGIALAGFGILPLIRRRIRKPAL